MEIRNQIQHKLKPYLQALPDMIIYQIATKALLGVWVFFLGKVFQFLLKSSGKVAVTSGDYQFLFTTWQGWIILLLGFGSLFLYVAFDINCMIILSRELVNGRKCPLKKCVKEGFSSIRKLFNIRGILVVLYIAFVSPILGTGISISLTKGLYIPTFISAFIKDSVLYSALAGFAALLFLSVGIANLYILHGIFIDDLPVGEAGKQSSAIIRANWKDYLKQNILCLLTIGGTIAGIAVVFLFIPLKLISILPLPGSVSRVLIIIFVIAGVVISALIDLVCIPMYIMKMTQLYYSYKQGREFECKEIYREKHGSHKWVAAIATIAVILIVFLTNEHFDELFPLESNVAIIAHRGGGDEGKENTLSGLDAAWKLGAYGSEIDIQRTKDGYYVINHDNSFKRVAGDKRKPKDMTLKEIRQLSIDGEPIPTFEEMLRASKNKLVLFAELKGSTADQKMAEDVVRLIKEYGMEDQCVAISLKYDVIDYIETKYPEIQTGFLTFATFGKTAALNCDYLALEEESASTDTVRAIHIEGKKALVWTANEKGSQRYFLCSQVDGIITDKVSQARKLVEELKKRNDLDRMIDKVKTIF